MKNFIDKLKLLFLFNSKEINGFILFSILICLFLLHTKYTTTSSRITPNDSIAFQAKIKQIKELNNGNLSTLFIFNPNNIDSLSFRKLGFSTRQTISFLKYRKTGVKFYKKEDFKKLYFINDSLYLIYSPFIQLESDTKDQQVTQTLFSFNPNKLTNTEWHKLAIPHTVVRNTQKYLQKGGHFQYKEDFKKIYGLTPSTYNKIKSYINLPSRPKQKTKIKHSPLNINTVTYKELLDLQISKKTAKTLLNFRKALGGFYSKSQLKEIYHITPKELERLDTLKVYQKSILKININKASQQELSKHPYIKSSVAKQIIAHRSYNKISELQTKAGLSKQAFQRMKPYLSTENK